jgi:hypothetical protein
LHEAFLAHSAIIRIPKQGPKADCLTRSGVVLRRLRGWFERQRQSQLARCENHSSAPGTPDNPRRCRSESTPASGPKDLAVVRSPPEHAQALLWWLRTRGTEDRLFHTDMLRNYKAMCDTLKFEPRAWSTVAKAFTELTTGRKVFAWVRLEDGSKHRWRVYPLTTRCADHRCTQLHDGFVAA